MTAPLVKICGLRDSAGLEQVAAAGAAYAGFVFFAKSPRAITLSEARDLARTAPQGLVKVALVVDAEEAFLDALTAEVALDMLQLHGQESPARVAAIKARYGLPVMKAVGIASAEDVAQLARYEAVADQILVDAKAPKDADLPGGNGLAFDWRLLAGYQFQKPWMLAGGLTPHNVAEALRLTGVRQVDVSSGVESAPGFKDAALISAFVQAAKTA